MSCVYVPTHPQLICIPTYTVSVWAYRSTCIISGRRIFLQGCSYKASENQWLNREKNPKFPQRLSWWKQSPLISAWAACRSVHSSQHVSTCIDESWGHMAVEEIGYPHGRQEQLTETLWGHEWEEAGLEDHLGEMGRRACRTWRCPTLKQQRSGVTKRCSGTWWAGIWTTGSQALLFPSLTALPALCSDSKCHRLQMQKPETTLDLLANSMETSFLLDLI